MNPLQKSIWHIFLVVSAATFFFVACSTKPTSPPTVESGLITAVSATSYPAPTAFVSEIYPPPATAVAISQAYPEAENENQTPVFTYQVINSYPHDGQAFTQGLLWADGAFYEGTGLNGRSSVRRVNLEDGEVLQIEPVPGEYFGEGLVLWDDKLIQLTWQSQLAFVYDKDSFEQVGQFDYETEGWGLTHDGRQLIMSDGTNTLYFRDPETFAEIGRVSVFDGDQPVVRLNELEYIDGEVWANVWQTNRIARIDPETGQVNSWLDLTGLLDRSNLTEAVDVLNGIAYDAENGRLFVTGKLWPTLYEIGVVPVEQ